MRGGTHLARFLQVFSHFSSRFRPILYIMSEDRETTFAVRWCVYRRGKTIKAFRCGKMKLKLGYTQEPWLFSSWAMFLSSCLALCPLFFFLSPLTNSILYKNNFNADCRWQFLFVKNRICKHSFSTKLDFLCARTNVPAEKGRRRRKRATANARKGRKREQPMGCSRGFQSSGITSIYSGPITSYWISKDWNCYLTFLKTHITIFSRIPDAPSCYFCSVGVQRIICCIMLLSTNCSGYVVSKRFTNIRKHNIKHKLIKFLLRWWEIFKYATIH